MRDTGTKEKNNQGNRSRYSGVSYALVKYRCCAGEFDRSFCIRFGLYILTYDAETECSFIKPRQAEGIAVAKARGIKFGCEKMNFQKNLKVFSDVVRW